MPRPFATSHSRGTKPPCWRAKEALGQDKQRKLLFKLVITKGHEVRTTTIEGQNSFAPSLC